MNDTSPRAFAGDRIQTVTTAGVAGLAIGAFLLSYDALHQLARTSHVPAPLAWLWPLIVDGFILVASLAVLDAVHTGQRARYPWMLVLASSTLSVTFNVLHAPHDLVAQLVAAIPPLALVLSFELLMRQIHHRLQQALHIQPSITHAPALEDHRPNTPATRLANTDVSTLPPLEPTGRSATGSPAKATRAPRAVTQAWAEAVRETCARAGQPLTTAVLADRLGISAGYARRLIRDLNDTDTTGEELAAVLDADLPLAGLRAVRP
ncbi:hypothetical protein acdb102_16250 [Acidothermaceae bacterium B102]|nr:hypothetical protein acdb102_16250 [Acidothermaceae bacterium B102]